MMQKQNPNNADMMQLEIFRRMPVAEKLALAAQLRQTNLELLSAGIRADHKQISPEELRLEVLRRILPPKLFHAAYGVH